MLFYTLLERYFLKKILEKVKMPRILGVTKTSIHLPDLETIAEVIDDSDINEEIEEWLITKLEIKNAIEDMKNG